MAGRVLLQNKHFAEAARFFADQLSTPRETFLDDEARVLHGLSLEGLGEFDEALHAYRMAAESANRSLAATASLRLARILIGMGQLGAAGRAALRAREIEPGAPAAETVRNALIELVRLPEPPTTSLEDREGVAALAAAMSGHFMTYLPGMRPLRPLRGIPLRKSNIQYSTPNPQ